MRNERNLYTATAQTHCPDVHLMCAKIHIRTIGSQQMMVLNLPYFSCSRSLRVWVQHIAEVFLVSRKQTTQHSPLWKHELLTRSFWFMLHWKIKYACTCFLTSTVTAHRPHSLISQVTIHLIHAPYFLLSFAIQVPIAYICYAVAKSYKEWRRRSSQWEGQHPEDFFYLHGFKTSGVPSCCC